MLPSSDNNPQAGKGCEPGEPKLDLFLVCGLGSLGQHCVAVLKEYGARVTAIDQVEPKNWEVSNLHNLLEELLIGDCRQTNVLEQAHISQCRTVILVTNDERVNIEAAFTARLLNPQVRLVVRSDKQNLNQLLSQNLGNFIAFEPNQLTASAFAFAALGNENLGYFNLEGQKLRVAKYQIKPDDSWCNKWQVHQLNTSFRRVLNYASSLSQLPHQFCEWESEAILQPGDTIVYVEIADLFPLVQKQAIKSKAKSQQFWQKIILRMSWLNLKRKLIQLWQASERDHILRVALICGMTVLILWGSGTIFYDFYYPNINFAEAFYTTAVLLLGGYGDVYGGVEFEKPIPRLLRLFSLGLTLAGTAFVGVLYALLTEKLLSSRFQFFFTSPRPSIPKQDHVVLMGLNQVGSQIASLLQELQQPLVAISNTAVDFNYLPQIPLIIGNFANDIANANITDAKSVVVVTDDEMENLEIALMAHGLNPNISLVIRTYNRNFSDKVAQLFPYAQVLCTAALSAEVFAAAAFGENILGLFHLNNQTIQVVEYMIEAGDTLNGLMLSDIAYGYGAVPILYQKSLQSPAKLLPVYETRLAVGDRMIVLATSNSLQRIERGELAPRNWQVRIERALTGDAVFDGANEISIISGCSISTARELMKILPKVVPQALYKQQAQRLVFRLNKLRVIAHCLPIHNFRISDN
ncbi:NAD-binding protein [Nostoc sp. FACHB-152]|uniref:potassium channel family protein n=1 Tax=unclassified Nostoc TaxID=2593658 RepID=UPI001682AFFD|nr:MULTISPECIES: potassium channel protein [unclassified Nostoc]MBD2451356.1 NAD-binding protein [Nostoc sp. FACHB-152]MBD2472035.1 NAD-binding protein [Nostoc sp. FACHB-145]